MIEENVFYDCTNMENVHLNEGLKAIGYHAFQGCASLERIVIPSTIDAIQSLDVFNNCRRLMALKFVDEIEEFMSETSLCSWWNQGVARHSLLTYCFLIKHDIAKRFGSLQASKWRNTILDMLECIPSIANKKQPSHFESIHSMLTVYHKLGEVALLLELALWKSKRVEYCRSRPISWESKLVEYFHGRPSVNLSSHELQQLRLDCGFNLLLPLLEYSNLYALSALKLVGVSSLASTHACSLVLSSDFDFFGDGVSMVGSCRFFFFGDFGLIASMGENSLQGENGAGRPLALAPTKQVSITPAMTGGSSTISSDRMA